MRVKNQLLIYLIINTFYSIAEFLEHYKNYMTQQFIAVFNHYLHPCTCAVVNTVYYACIMGPVAQSV